MIKTDNLNQIGVLFKAFGCTLDYSPNHARLDLSGTPKGKVKIVEEALQDLAKMEKIENYIAGITPLLIADTVDSLPNPLSEYIRERILETIGLKYKGRYITQKLVLIKNNGLWHLSDIAFQCTHFGSQCNERGIHPDPERKGKISHRQPEEYHKMNSKGEIQREQLTTRALEKLVDMIPLENITRSKSFVELNLRDYSKSSYDDKLKAFGNIGASR
jgi:hypothetical protein